MDSMKVKKSALAERRAALSEVDARWKTKFVFRMLMNLICIVSILCAAITLMRSNSAFAPRAFQQAKTVLVYLPCDALTILWNMINITHFCFRKRAFSNITNVLVHFFLGVGFAIVGIYVTIIAWKGFKDLDGDIYMVKEMGEHMVTAIDGSLVRVNAQNVARCPAFSSCKAQAEWVTSAKERALISVIGCVLFDVVFTLHCLFFMWCINDAIFGLRGRTQRQEEKDEREKRRIEEELNPEPPLTPLDAKSFDDSIKKNSVTLFRKSSSPTALPPTNRESINTKHNHGDGGSRSFISAPALTQHSSLTLSQQPDLVNPKIKNRSMILSPSSGRASSRRESLSLSIFDNEPSRSSPPPPVPSQGRTSVFSTTSISSTPSPLQAQAVAIPQHYTRAQQQIDPHYGNAFSSQSNSQAPSQGPPKQQQYRSCNCSSRPASSASVATMHTMHSTHSHHQSHQQNQASQQQQQQQQQQQGQGRYSVSRSPSNATSVTSPSSSVYSLHYLPAVNAPPVPPIPQHIQNMPTPSSRQSMLPPPPTYQLPPMNFVHSSSPSPPQQPNPQPTPSRKASPHQPTPIHPQQFQPYQEYPQQQQQHQHQQHQHQQHQPMPQSTPSPQQTHQQQHFRQQQSSQPHQQQYQQEEQQHQHQQQQQYQQQYYRQPPTAVLPQPPASTDNYQNRPTSSERNSRASRGMVTPAPPGPQVTLPDNGYFSHSPGTSTSSNNTYRQSGPSSGVVVQAAVGPAVPNLPRRKSHLRHEMRNSGVF